MVHRIYAVSSEWAGTKGGINIFNSSLVEAMARVVDQDVEIHAVIASDAALPTGVGSNLRFQSYESTAKSLAEMVKTEIGDAAEKPTSVTLIGHDVHTGEHAVQARDILKECGLKTQAAVFCHMDYSKYQAFKDTIQREIAEKRARQRAVICAADHVYAVGPSLKASFEQLRKDNNAEPTIHEIIPGFPPVLKTTGPGNPSDALKFFFSGRIDPENDRVKNGRLALKAIFKAYSKNASLLDSRWNQRGSFAAYGFTDGKVDQNWFCDGIDRNELGKYLILNLQGFTAQEEMFAELRDSHIALMPSIQEGFGLSGWEAVCAGVPLICSDQSGLAQFLEQRFQLEHNLPRESVRMIRLGNSEADIDDLAKEIEGLASNYERSLSHARQLADYLEEHFSWDDAARNVASPLGLARSGSANWRTRQYQGRAALARHRTEGNEQACEVAKALDFAARGKALSEWSISCTALNYLSDLGKEPTYASLDSARTQLAAIAKGISDAYEADLRTTPDLRCSGRFDVAWRYMAAASSIETTFKGFLESIPDPMMHEIRGDGFLGRELLHYATKYADKFDDMSRQVAVDFFAEICRQAVTDDALQIRLARLEAAVPELSPVIDLDPVACPAYVKEQEQCAKVQENAFDLNDLLASADELAPTALALASIDAKMHGRGIEQLFAAWQEHNQEIPAPTWRGDKLLRAALLAASVHPRRLVALIEALAADEEEALRWAAIDLAFSPTLRERLFNASRLGVLAETPGQLKARLGAIVDKAIETGDFHPWMQREFLIRFHREHATPVLFSVEDRFFASDFPVARTLIGPPLASESPWLFASLHPEVQINARKLREHVQRVLLVLPPISPTADTWDVSSTSTPPLGLGMIGSELLAAGHDVYLADCHRAPAMRDRVIGDAQNFDWVGFNVVLPTMRSVLSIATAIKALPNPPAIVVGGPAVNARSFRNAAVGDEESRCWDFEIHTRAGANFATLVANFGQGQRDVPAGIVPNERSDCIIRTGQSLITNTAAAIPPSSWLEPVFLDRRIFSTHAGAYEPQRTRAINGTAVEAHVVMSRGCNWNCSFCTERVQQSGGERRRPLESVEQELKELARRNPDLRIQFVDDNLLPQIATLTDQRVAWAQAVDWAEKFLSMLSEVRAAAPIGFGWRGIFRVEDFLHYEAAFPNFIGQLATSGCRMLAFGIEHGNETKRRKMKAGKSATNAEFTALFSRLRDAGIHSKAYFILGGPKETAETSLETIAFAIESGVSLAYFALYKEFVPALQSLRSEQSRGSEAHRSYSDYEQLDIVWDAILGEAMQDPNCARFHDLVGGLVTDDRPLDPADLISVYDDLSRLGFRFTDLVKYSDHHSENSPSADILNKVNFGDQAIFEKTVASAYLRFYLRRSFVDTYRALLADGY